MFRDTIALAWCFTIGKAQGWGRFSDCGGKLASSYAHYLETVGARLASCYVHHFENVGSPRAQATLAVLIMCFAKLSQSTRGGTVEFEGQKIFKPQFGLWAVYSMIESICMTSSSRTWSSHKFGSHELLLNLYCVWNSSSNRYYVVSDKHIVLRKF